MSKLRFLILDRIGALLSCICVVHCFLTPVLLALYPAYVHEGNDFHWGMAFVLLAIAGFAFYRGYQIHSQQKILKFGVIGITLIFVGVLGPGLIPDPYGIFTSVFTTIGGSFLIFAHFWNIRLAKCHCCKVGLPEDNNAGDRAPQSAMKQQSFTQDSEQISKRQVKAAG